FLQQVLLEAAGVDPDADRAAVGLGRADHFGNPLARADVARIDAQARGAGVGRLERALVVEVDVGDQRHPYRAGDLAQSGGALDVGARHADQVRPGLLAAADLVDRRGRVGRRRVRHRLNRNRRIAADRDLADHDLAARPPVDRAPRANFVHLSGSFADWTR